MVIQPRFSRLCILIHVYIAVVTLSAEKARTNMRQDVSLFPADGFAQNGPSSGFALFTPVLRMEGRRSSETVRAANFITATRFIDYTAIHK
jgi:hypothetical protein